MTGSASRVRKVPELVLTLRRGPISKSQVRVRWASRTGGARTCWPRSGHCRCTPPRPREHAHQGTAANSSSPAAHLSTTLLFSMLGVACAQTDGRVDRRRPAARQEARARSAHLLDEVLCLLIRQKVVQPARGPALTGRAGSCGCAAAAGVRTAAPLAPSSASPPTGSRCWGGPPSLGGCCCCCRQARALSAGQRFGDAGQVRLREHLSSSRRGWPTSGARVSLCAVAHSRKRRPAPMQTWLALRAIAAPSSRLLDLHRPARACSSAPARAQAVPAASGAQDHRAPAGPSSALGWLAHANGFACQGGPAGAGRGGRTAPSAELQLLGEGPRQTLRVLLQRELPGPSDQRPRAPDNGVAFAAKSLMPGQARRAASPAPDSLTAAAGHLPDLHGAAGGGCSGRGAYFTAGGPGPLSVHLPAAPAHWSHQTQCLLRGPVSPAA